MTFQTRRPIKFSFRVRQNFKTRDWTSIGLRGAGRKAHSPTKPVLSSSGRSYAPGEASRSIGLPGPAPKYNQQLVTDRRGWIWIALTLLAILAAAYREST